MKSNRIFSFFCKKIFQKSLAIIPLIFIFNLPSLSIRKAIATSNELKIEKFAYKLGPGDVIFMNITNVVGFETNVQIIPDGTVILPRIGAVNIWGLSLKQAQEKITNEYSKIINRPIIYLNLISSRPIKISIFGQVQRPGIYSLTTNEISKLVNSDGGEGSAISSSGWPTLIDAIQKAGGINNVADLKNITIKRKLNEKDYISLNTNYWNAIINGNIVDNPLIYDGDNIFVALASDIEIEDSLKISSSNLASPTITVNVIGEVPNPGPQKIKTNSPLSQAILSSGGITRRGKRNNVELIRMNPNGSISVDRFNFKYQQNSDLEINPPLIDGDIIVINRSNWTKFNDGFKDIVQPVGPMLNAATIYRLLNEI